MFGGAFRAIHWVSDCRYGFAKFPGNPERLRLTKPTGVTADENSDITLPEEPHLAYVQQHILAFYFEPTTYRDPPDILFHHYRTWLDPSQEDALFGPATRYNSYGPRAWMFPKWMPHPVTGMPSNFNEQHLTLALLRILHKLDLNLYYLRNYFCLVPDPQGQGPLTYQHPIMRRLAAIAYCVHYTSEHGLLYDVARECGRSRAQQAFSTFDTGDSDAHLERTHQMFLAAELHALAPDHSTTMYRCFEIGDASRVEQRLDACFFWSEYIDTGRAAGNNLDFLDGAVTYPDPEFKPLLCPWRARTAWLSWDSGGAEPGFSAELLRAERTAYTHRACDSLLMWAKERSGPLLD